MHVNEYFISILKMFMGLYRNVKYKQHNTISTKTTTIKQYFCFCCTKKNPFLRLKWWKWNTRVKLSEALAFFKVQNWFVRSYVVWLDWMVIEMLCWLAISIVVVVFSNFFFFAPFHAILGFWLVSWVEFLRFTYPTGTSLV